MPGSIDLLGALEDAQPAAVEADARQLDGRIFFAHRSTDMVPTVLLKELIELEARHDGVRLGPDWHFICHEYCKDGDDYVRTVTLAIVLAKHVVLIASQKCRGSHFVPLEVDIALSLATQMTIVAIDDVDLRSIHPRLPRRSTGRLREREAGAQADIQIVELLESLALGRDVYSRLRQSYGR